MYLFHIRNGKKITLSAIKAEPIATGLHKQHLEPVELSKLLKEMTTVNTCVHIGLLKLRGQGQDDLLHV